MATGTWLTILSRLALALLAAAALACCGSLPKHVDTLPSAAVKPTPGSPLVRIALDSIPAPELSGFRLMPLGIYSLDARVQLVRRARYSLDLQYYLIDNDQTGHLLLRNLRDAALRGVRVRLLVDDLDTVGEDPLFVGLTAFSNVEVRLFNPFCCARETLASKFAASLFDIGRLNHRMHNKLFIADGAIAVAGGRNIADEYFMRGAQENFVDMDALIVGAIVPRLEAIFDTYWNSPYAYPAEAIVSTDLDREQLRSRFDSLVDDGEEMMSVALPPIDILGYGPISHDLDGGRLGLIWCKASAFADPPAKVTSTSDEMAGSTSVSMNVMDLVMRSKYEVVLVSPYFIPGPTGVQAFGDLRQRDVKVMVVTNSLASTDNSLVYFGYSRYRADLLRNGVDLYELDPTRIVQNKRLLLPGRLHAKLAVIDRSTVFIGSMNLDPRSASKNTELGIIAENPQLAREVLRVIQVRLQSAYRLRLGPDGQSLEWLIMGDAGEVVLTTEPETSFLMRLENVLFAPFVPEQEL